MNWQLPDPAAAYRALGSIALLSLVAILWLGPMFGVLFFVMVLAIAYDVGEMN